MSGKILRFRRKVRRPATEQGRKPVRRRSKWQRKLGLPWFMRIERRDKVAVDTPVKKRIAR